METKFKPKKKEYRLFIAFEIPEEVKRQLNSNTKIFLHEARNIRFVSMEQMHLTIKFLGRNVSDYSINKIVDVLKEIAGKTYPITLSVKELRFGFPHQTIPQILFYNIESTPELNALYKEIGIKIKRLDLGDVIPTAYMKKDIYHVTLGRLKHQQNRSFGRQIRSIVKESPIDPIDFTVSEFSIIKSDIEGGKGPKYAYIHKFQLKQYTNEVPV